MAMLNHLFWIICCCVILSGCQLVNAVTVKNVDAKKTLSTERESILTGKSLSQASINTLTMVSPKVETCINNPTPCLTQLMATNEFSDEQILSTGSELFLTQAVRLKSQSACQPDQPTAETTTKKTTLTYEQCISQYLEALNQSLRYSYAYLFMTERHASQRIFNNRQIQVTDFYNQAIANLITELNNYQKKDIDFKNKNLIGNSGYSIDVRLYPNLHLDNIEKMISTYRLSFSGLQTTNRRDGFGASFVIQLKNDKKMSNQQFINIAQLAQYSLDEHPNIHLMPYLPATVVVEPVNRDTITEVLTSQDFVLRLINPNLYEEVVIQDNHLQLSANFSAPYGLSLADTKMGSKGLQTLVNHKNQFILPHLIMSESYNPNKKLVIMLHGLASSPETWVSISNDIMNDAVLRENYQIWQVFYSTNMPILENRYQINQLLRQAFDKVSKPYPNHQPTNAIIIGHSMGGVISRMLLSDNNLLPSAMTYIGKKCKQCYKYGLTIDNVAEITDGRFLLQSLTPTVKRAVFIASPFQGTTFADKFLPRVARKIIKLPANFVENMTHRLIEHSSEQQRAELLEAFQDGAFQNGASELSPTSGFMQVTKDVRMNPSIQYHLIIGNNTKSHDENVMTDGIVPYKSSFLSGAVSNKVIAGGHSIHNTPEAVLELRRILRLHLQESSP